MAKVSKINIAITGDSKGLARATDAATRELRRLEAQTERTTKRLGASRQTVNQAAEAMAKLGVQSRAIGGIGGAIGLAQVAVSGGPLGVGVIAGAAAVGGTAALIAAGQQVADISQRARKAIEDVSLDARKRIEEQGFSMQLAQAIAAQGGGFKTAGQNLGMIDSLFAGLAATRGGLALSQMSAAAAGASTYAGVIAGGGGTAAASQLAAAQMRSGDAAQDAQTAIALSQMAYSPGGPLGYLLQQILGD